MGGCAAGEGMSKQRPEQGVLRLATDRGSRKEGGASRSAASDNGPNIEGGSVPVADDLPVFEEDSTLAIPPELVARTILDERSLPGEQLRLLAARLRAMGMDRRLRRIGVVSSAQGEGKTTVALDCAVRSRSSGSGACCWWRSTCAGRRSTRRSASRRRR